jgi:hypothetical protein
VTELGPELLFVMWGAGVAAGAALVAHWRVVGPGYVWLAGSVGLALAALAAASGAGAIGWIAAGAGLGGTLAAKAPLASQVLFVLSAALLLVAGYEPGLETVALLVTGTMLLGGVTSEMMLGHWFLVDPTLPRKPLFDLAESAAIGLAGEAVAVVATGSIALGAALSWVWLALVVTGGLLIAGVWFSLREPRYSGVMAATGLSYLAVLVSFGIVAVGRALVGAA